MTLCKSDSKNFELLSLALNDVSRTVTVISKWHPRISGIGLRISWVEMFRCLFLRAGGKMRICGCADVVKGNLRMLLRYTLYNIRTSAKYSCLINDAKSPFISLNVTVLATKILGKTYEKLRLRSDLGTSEENLMLNLRKTFDQCSICSFGSAVLDPQITRYTRRFSPQLCSANYPL